MNFSVTLSANAGVSLELGGKKIWIDALHREKQPGFSTVTDDLLQKMKYTPAFQNPDLVICTHCHEDHCSFELLSQIKSFFPDAKLLLAEQKINDQILISGDKFLYQCGQIQLQFIRLVHEGKRYENTENYGIIIGFEGKNVLIPGDCRLCEQSLAEAVSNIKIDLALLNFPWLTLPKSRAFVLEQIRPENALFYHLPFEEDDVNGYRPAAEKVLQKMENPHFGLLYRPLQRIEFEL